MLSEKNPSLVCRITAILLVVLLASCAAPQIYHGQLGLLDKGLTPSQVISRLQLEPLSQHTDSSTGRMFEFYQYRLNNGIQQDVYFLAFEDQRLVYWGYISEFRRQTDRSLAKALDNVLAEPSRRKQ
jgi:hypothetical protein